MGSILAIVFAGLRGALPLLGGFFTGGLSWVWGLASAFLGTEIGAKIAIGLACVLGGFIWGFSHEHAVKERAVAEAVASRDVDWQKEITAANAKNEQRVQEALNAARNVAPASSIPADLAKLCATERPTCRGEASKRRVVQTPKSNVGH